MKDRSQPDEMVADVKILGEDELAVLPYIEATPEQFNEYLSSISSIQQAWEKTQPFLVETTHGKREERIMLDGKLQPRPALEPSNN